MTAGNHADAGDGVTATGVVGNALRDTQGAVAAAIDSVRTTAHVLVVVAQTQMRERPYVALSVAGGAGFIVAGGLASPAVRGLVQLGARVAATAAVGLLSDVIAGAIAPSAAPPHVGHAGNHAHTGTPPPNGTDTAKSTAESIAERISFKSKLKNEDP